MPSAKRKRKSDEAGLRGQSDDSAMHPGGQPVKQSGKRSRKNKAKKAAKRKKNMNLPTRLARLLNYKNKRAQIEAVKSQSVKFEQKLHVQGKSSSTTGDRRRNYLQKGRTNAFSSPGSFCKTYVSQQRTLDCRVVSNRQHNSSGRDTDCECGEGGAGGQTVIPKEKFIALDCEMVGVGPEGRTSALARCSIVDYDCNVLYDAYIKPELEIADYRTMWSGIRKHHMDEAIPFPEAQQQIANILRGKILVGHALRFDIQVLQFSHPSEDTRDTSLYRGLRELAGLSVSPRQHPGLKKLTKLLFGHSIQEGEHCSVEDAKATMNLYKLVESQWEEERMSVFPDQDFRVSFMDDHFWPDDLDQ